MAQIVEALEGPRQTDRLAEVPAVAQDDEGRPFVQEPPVSSEEILQAGSDPSSSSHGSEVSRGRPGRVEVTLPRRRPETSSSCVPNANTFVRRTTRWSAWTRAKSTAS